MDWDLFPAFVLCVLGVGAVIGAVVAFPDAGQVEYYHSVERVSNDTVPNDSRPLAYDDLSPAARAVVRDAQNAPDNEAIVTDPKRKPPEFEYPGDESPIYYVRDNGSYYVLRTGKTGGGPLAVMGLAVKGILGISGLTLLSIGGYWLNGRQRPAPLTMVGFVGSIALVGGIGLVFETCVLVLLTLWLWLAAVILMVPDWIDSR